MELQDVRAGKTYNVLVTGYSIAQPARFEGRRTRANGEIEYDFEGGDGTRFGVTAADVTAIEESVDAFDAWNRAQGIDPELYDRGAGEGSAR